MSWSRRYEYRRLRRDVNMFLEFWDDMPADMTKGEMSRHVGNTLCDKGKHTEYTSTLGIYMSLDFLRSHLRDYKR